jgi:hypothetical protein
MDNFLKPLQYGSFLDRNNYILFIKMCKEADLPYESAEDLPTLSKLEKLSGLSHYDFKNSCFSFYVAIEEDDWNPSQEICGICVYMKQKHKAWDPKIKKWVEWEDRNGS